MSREWVPKNLSGLMKLSQSNEVFTFLSFFFSMPIFNGLLLCLSMWKMCIKQI